MSYTDFIEKVIAELGDELNEEEITTLREGNVTDAVKIILAHIDSTDEAIAEETSEAVTELTEGSVDAQE